MKEERFVLCLIPYCSFADGCGNSLLIFVLLYTSGVYGGIHSTDHFPDEYLLCPSLFGF